MNILFNTNEAELISEQANDCMWFSWQAEVKWLCRLRAVCILLSSHFLSLANVMALKSSYLLFYPKQPYFCHTDWNGVTKQRFVSCCVILNRLFCDPWITFKMLTSFWEAVHDSYGNCINHKVFSHMGQIYTFTINAVTSFEL